jgi:hypothetical protein
VALVHELEKELHHAHQATSVMNDDFPLLLLAERLGLGDVDGFPARFASDYFAGHNATFLVTAASQVHREL